ncbi:hypothetical protein [Mesorhizobium retamae]|uniref:Uncharacterized protein n=1 Tax=Mesorhizobium retamae TaxID=2912854 RepID=A0ABS9QDN2_9HYPH|nr:hypothetical protein [Mesorhizobium sp. IRAMC:0171]MCG7505519.1 hypothetical protein [Mesorhizobium sp. IRAMC:0171]
MSKFKFKLKLTGLELEMEGSREDIPLITQNIGNQLAGLMKPAADIASEKDGTEPSFSPLTINHSIEDKSTNKRTKRRPRTNPQPQANGANIPPIEWTHDPSKFGNPQQTWSTAKKSIWLIYVVSQISKVSQLQTSQIVEIFNRKFRQFKTINTSNVSRDLGRAKTSKPSLVGEDTAKSPTEWFLTDEGIKSAQESISEGTKI